jgi:hypothetical protein
MRSLQHNAHLLTSLLSVICYNCQSQIYNPIDNSNSYSNSQQESIRPQPARLASPRLDAASNTTASPYLSAHFVQRDDAFATLLCLFGLDLIILRYRVHQPR